MRESREAIVGTSPRPGTLVGGVASETPLSAAEHAVGGLAGPAPAAARASDRVPGRSDDELWRAAQSGDAEAFGALFDRHHQAIYNYCFRRIGDWGLAEDLTSIVFLEAWRRRDKELLPEKVLPWLFGIATNVVRNADRSLRRHSRALARYPREHTPDFSEDVQQRLADEEQMRQVLERIADLSEAERDVLALCVWEELSYEDAAHALEIPVGTVRSRLFRARQHVRELTAAGGHETGEWKDEEFER